MPHYTPPSPSQLFYHYTHRLFPVVWLLPAAAAAAFYTLPHPLPFRYLCFFVYWFWPLCFCSFYTHTHTHTFTRLLVPRWLHRFQHFDSAQAGMTCPFGLALAYTYTDRTDRRTGTDRQDRGRTWDCPFPSLCFPGLVWLRYSMWSPFFQFPPVQTCVCVVLVGGSCGFVGLLLPHLLPVPHARAFLRLHCARARALRLTFAVSAGQDLTPQSRGTGDV